jgi:polyisoprenoid-binding protein YceI
MRMKMLSGLTVAAFLLLTGANAADNYKIDPAHSRVGFSIRHLTISNVKGVFDEFNGSIVLDNGVLKEASATIQVKSINTGVGARDDHLRTAEFFDSAKFPVITFNAKRVENIGGQTRLIGDFTMHGVTKELVLPFKLSGPIKDPMGGTRIGIEAGAIVNRKDYGLNFDKTMETGGLLIGYDVAIEINAEAIKETAASPGNK